MYIYFTKGLPKTSKMLLVVTIVSTIACLCQPGIAKTVKQKRDLEDMPTNYLGAEYSPSYLEDYGSGSYYSPYDQNVEMYFYVTYDKEFNDDWLSFDSPAYQTESELVKEAMTEIFTTAMGLAESDVTVEVTGFVPSETKAEILLTLPSWLQYSNTDVINYLGKLDSFGTTIGGATILKIEDQMEPMAPQAMSESIVLELTYDFDTSDGSIDLSNPVSEAYQAEAESLKNQLVLLLIDKLAAQGVIANPGQIELHVLKFVSEGTYTTAELTASPNGIDIEQLSYALQFLAIEDDVRINGRPIISLEELEREILYYDGQEMNETVMEEDYLDGIESIPPDEFPETLFPNGEVMLDKDLINGVSLPDNNDYGTIPPSRSDHGISGLEKELDRSEAVEEIAPEEPTPPEEAEPTPPEETEPTPPDEREPVPSDEIQYCDEVRAPIRGEMECFGDLMEGARCQFTCAEETRMEGPDTIICTRGYWNADPPVCRRIFCEPYYQTIENGQVDCIENNVYASVCTFTCNPEFRLIGTQTIVCQRDQTWTSAAPICEPEPVICEEEYGDWSECAGGARSKDSVSVTRGGVTTDCPRVTEACIDCELGWKVWSECDEDMLRYREQYVRQEKVGAGEECAEPGVESEECKDCILRWGEYSACEEGSRSRTQYVAQLPVGGSECPPLDTEEQDCFDCVVEWGEWSACTEGFSTRSQVVTSEAVNGGEACPELGYEEEECQNCVAEWGEWSSCVGGVSSRTQYVVTEATGHGKACTLQSENQECADCRIAWSGWSSCVNGFSEREEVVTQPQVGTGEACRELRRESRECVHCRLEWGDWEECIEGNRRRVQFVAQEAAGAGTPCDPPQDQFQDCAVCELRWSEWSECSDGSRGRTQFVFQSPYNSEPCPELRTETEPCIDCVYTWGEWEECQFGIERRYMTIEVEPVGAGELCPEEQAETRECCYLDWSEWSECEDGVRTRIQEVLIRPDGAVCPEPEVDSETCADCVLEWGPWSECENNRVSRTEIVVEEAVGAGLSCPEVQIESEYCADCVVEWGDWGVCADGMQERVQVVVEDRVGRGKDCPPLQFEERDCADCQWEQTEWSACASGQRYRDIVIIQPAKGVGVPCPDATREFEACVDCEVEWGEWSRCEDGQTARTQVVSVAPVGAGRECPQLGIETDVCIDCVLGWREWSECSGGFRTRTQYVVTMPEGQGLECPRIRTMQEECVDCVVEWGPWTTCFNNLQRREQSIVTETVGAGERCPEMLDIESRECSRNDSVDVEKTMCRFVDVVLGWKRSPTMRDLLLLGDESGSIGWVNFEKIKENFKSISRNIRGGIGTQETQLAMSSFARYSRIIFDFDDYYDVDDIAGAIDEVIFKGGFRSRIGGALSDVNTWVFQQSAGMRSFPKLDDNIDHEILIATDGCRTYDVYHLKQGLKALKSRGIKLYVLAIASKDERCQQTIKSMVDDEDNLFELASWENLVELTRVIEERACVTSDGDEAESEE